MQPLEYTTVIRWQVIESAEHVPGKEILGIQIFQGKIVKGPFMTFWSPTLDRFYRSPTHWSPFPLMPS